MEPGFWAIFGLFRCFGAPLLHVLSVCLCTNVYVPNSDKPSISLLSTNKLCFFYYSPKCPNSFENLKGNNFSNIVYFCFVTGDPYHHRLILTFRLSPMLHKSAELWICQMLPPKCLLNAAFAKGQVPRITRRRRSYFQRFQLTYQELWEPASAKTTFLYCDHANQSGGDLRGQVCVHYICSPINAQDSLIILCLCTLHFIFNTPWKFH